MVKITDTEFKQLVTMMKSTYGVNLENKRILIEGRLSNVLREKGCSNFTQYLELIKKDKNGDEVNLMLNKLTTNHTFFMREENHFKFLRDTILPNLDQKKLIGNMRIWSAGCSVGAEAYTTAMVIDDYKMLRKTSYRPEILATDISSEVLKKGQAGIYNAELFKDVPAAWKKRYFKEIGKDQYQIIEPIRQLVQFKTMNLMDNFLFPKKFHLIFCRNVMIYFDQKTRENLVNKFYTALEPGGYLFIGHSESINRESTKFKYVMPAIYCKEE